MEPGDGDVCVTAGERSPLLGSERRGRGDLDAAIRELHGAAGANCRTLLADAVEPSHASSSWLAPFYVNVFFACASFSIVMPSLAPYLLRMGAPLTFLSWVVSSYAVGEMVGSIAFGWYYEWALSSVWLRMLAGGSVDGGACESRRRPWLQILRLAGKGGEGVGPKTSVALCILVGVVGSGMYAAADWVSDATGPWLVFWARFVQGIWTGGQQTVEQAYLSAAAPQDRRVELTATLSSFAVMGFVIGPSFGAAFTSIDCEVMGLRVDAYNAPGIFIFGVTVVMLVQTLLFFDGTDDRGAGDMDAERLDASDDERDGISSKPDGANSTTGVLSQQPNHAGICVCICLFFVHYYSFAIQETITTPLVIHLYEWDPLQVNLLFVGAGILSLVSSVAIQYLSRVVDDRAMLLFSVIVGLAGSLLMIDRTAAGDVFGEEGGFDVAPSLLPVDRFLLGFALVTIAFPFGRNVTLGVFSNVIGPQNQGRWMGIMLAVGTLPRILGPFAAVWALEVVDWRTWLEFGSVAALFVVALGAALSTYRRLVPLSEFGKDKMKIEKRASQSPMLHSPMVFGARERKEKELGPSIRHKRPKAEATAGKLLRGADYEKHLSMDAP